MTNLEKKFPKVAIVADQMSAFGGADREMYSVLKLFPHAEIFTIIFEKSQYPTLKHTVHTSFVQKISDLLPKQFFRHLKVFTPFAYENFDLEGFDLVVSISAGPGKSVLTGIDQPHVAMVMTPPRSLWDKELNARSSLLKSLYLPISIVMNTYLRVWDWTTVKRVDYWTANSEYISKKVWKFYKKKAQVIYPGVEKKYFKDSSSEQKRKVREKYNLPDDFVLVVSRLYDHKRIDWAINACKKANKNLVIVGKGPDIHFLKKTAGRDKRIRFLGFIKDDMEVKTIYELSDVLLFCGLEDFGLVIVEAMASGTPSLGYGKGGLLETISPGKTGEFFQTEDELTSLLINFNKKRYNKEQIKKYALQFSERKFLHNLEKYLNKVYEKESQKKRI